MAALCCIGCYTGSSEGRARITRSDMLARFLWLTIRLCLFKRPRPTPSAPAPTGSGNKKAKAAVAPDHPAPSSQTPIPPDFVSAGLAATEPPVTRSPTDTFRPADPATPSRRGVASMILSTAAFALAAAGISGLERSDFVPWPQAAVEGCLLFRRC